MVALVTIFLVTALMAALLGFSGLAGDAAATAKPLLVALLLVFLVSLSSGRRAV